MEEGAPRQVNGARRGRAAGAGQGGRGVSFTPRAPQAPVASPRSDPQPLPGPSLPTPCPALRYTPRRRPEHGGESFVPPRNVPGSPPSDSEPLVRPAHEHV